MGEFGLMTITFTCTCGKPLVVDEAHVGRKAFCTHCRTSVDIPEDAADQAANTPGAQDADKGGLVDDLEPSPDAPKSDSDEDVEVIDPRHVDRVPDKKRGGECWKLTCVCGKRIHSPLQPDTGIGRCPKCGRRLRLPGFRPSKSQRVKKQKPATVESRPPAKPEPPKTTV